MSFVDEKPQITVSESSPYLEEQHKLATSATNKPKVAVRANLTVNSGSHDDWLRQAGIAEKYWECAKDLIEKESNWKVHVANPITGAYGIPQALPPQKMASAGADWRDNPVTQLKWMQSYVIDRYGGWCQALYFWKYEAPKRNGKHWY